MAAFPGPLSLEKPVSWCLGPDWEVLVVKGAGDLGLHASNQKDILQDFSVRALGFWLQLEQRKGGGKEIPFLFLSDLSF